jgi:hypothetical protein
MKPTRSSQPPVTGRRRAARRVVAGGSALALGGLSLAIGPTPPADAGHGGTANSGILNTTTWGMYETLPWPPGSNPKTGISWGIAVWNAHAELTVRNVTQGGGTANVLVTAIGTADFWAGLTSCNGTVDPVTRNCPSKHVQLNNTQIDAAPDPTSTWKMVACHEFGHVGGLNHRFDTTNSCMATGQPSPPILALPDQHDNDAIAATYPR